MRYIGGIGVSSNALRSKRFKWWYGSTETVNDCNAQLATISLWLGQVFGVH